MTNYTFDPPKVCPDGKLRVKVRGLRDFTLKRAVFVQTNDEADTVTVAVSSGVEDVVKLQSELLNVAYLNRSTWFPGRTVGMDDIKKVMHHAHDGTEFVLDARVVPKVFTALSRRERSLHKDLTRGCVVDIVVRMEGVFFERGRFGAKWVARQVRVHEPKMDSYAFADESESESD